MATGRRRRNRRNAFTLIEVLVALAILALLVGLTATAVQKVRAAAARAACQSNLRQLAVGVQNYLATHNRYPPGCDYPYWAAEYDEFRQAGVSWQTALLPFVEQDQLWAAAAAAHAQDPTGESAAHDAVAATPVAVFRCPTEGRAVGSTDSGISWGVTNYLGVAGTHERLNNGVMHRRLTVWPADVTDGTSNTVFTGERPSGPRGFYAAWYAGWGIKFPVGSQYLAVRAGDWFPYPANDCAARADVFYAGKPDDACDVNHFWSLHPGGANFAFADGSARFLGYSATGVLQDLATRAGGEPVPAFD